MTDLGPVWSALWSELPVGVILVATVLVAWLASVLVGRLLRQSYPPVARAARQAAVGVISVIGATLILQQLGVNPDVILVILALLGATVLIALWGPLGNYAARYFSDIYLPFKVGDTITLRGFSGQVIGINAMVTVLLTEDDHLVSVPNDVLLKEVVVNTSPQAWKEVTIPLSIGNNVDLALFESDLLKSISKLKTRLDPRFPPVLTTRSRTAQATELVLTLMLRRPEDRDAITQEANKRLGELLQGSRTTRRPAG
ncbi:MAG TPA: mechanosensitive ion channel domain-containing protein [Thermoplasmata archaeon]|nr:mechanosensitive ion channel domain-containing protein [Thermoplasmata archaeon]